MNESGFINKVNKKLSSKIYKWKINDSYHNGVPDTYYAGPGAFCFVEYKYKAKLPVRGTSKINFGLSIQQELWLNIQKEFNIPVFVIAGCENKLVCLQTDFKKCNIFTRDTFLKEAIDFQDLINLLNIHCLGGTQGLGETHVSKESGILQKLLRQ